MYCCDNCDWKGTELGRELWDIPHLHERIEEGGIVPAGECPECGCFAYPDDDQQRLRDVAPELLAACEAMVEAFRQSHSVPVSLNNAYTAVRAAIARAKG